MKYFYHILYTFFNSSFTNSVRKLKNIFVEHKNVGLQLLAFWGPLTMRSFTLKT